MDGASILTLPIAKESTSVVGFDDTLTSLPDDGGGDRGMVCMYREDGTCVEAGCEDAEMRHRRLVITTPRNTVNAKTAGSGVPVTSTERGVLM